MKILPISIPSKSKKHKTEKIGAVGASNLQKDKSVNYRLYYDLQSRLGLMLTPGHS